MGRRAVGWGETPLSVQWVWPSALPYGDRHDALRRFCLAMARRWSEFREFGHPLEIGHRFQQEVLDEELGRFSIRNPSVTHRGGGGRSRFQVEAGREQLRERPARLASFGAQ